MDEQDQRLLKYDLTITKFGEADDEYAALTIDGFEVFRLYLSDAPENWPLLIRMIASAVRRTAGHYDQSNPDGASHD